MQLGRKLREIWRLRAGFAASVALGLLAALWSVEKISVLPPRLESRSLDISAASTRALVDAPRSTVLDLGATTTDIRSFTNRALLISNVMASAPVREYIARRAGVRAEQLQIASPVTPDWPRPLDRPGERKSTGDILKEPDEYRLSLQSNPTVPVIDVYAEAPSDEAAARLANGAVSGTRDYLRVLGAAQGIRSDQQVRLQQLGAAKGGPVNAGADFKIALLSFVIVFALSCAAALFLSRTRRGWRTEPVQAGLRGSPAPRTEA